MWGYCFLALSPLLLLLFEPLPPSFVFLFYSSVLFVFYIIFIFSILIVINMAENGVNEIANQLETLTAQSPAPQDASHLSASQSRETEYASRDSFLN